MRRTVLFMSFIFILASASWLPLAYGKPVYMKDLPSKFKDQCTTCHTSPSGMGGLNRFGADYEYSGYSMDGIAKLDSDRDGYTNGQELAAGTFPGDPDSYPGSESPSIPMEWIVFIAAALAAVATLFWLVNRLRP